MKPTLLTLALAAAAALALAGTAQADDDRCGACCHKHCGTCCSNCCRGGCGVCGGGACGFCSNKPCRGYVFADGSDGWVQITPPPSYNPGYPWHGSYYHVQYGAPLALLVPPTATHHTEYGWGVGNSRITPIAHQFSREYPGPIAEGGSGWGFRPLPAWPSDTTQFGVYYVRGPWY